jgi:hypothetical protein
MRACLRCGQPGYSGACLFCGEKLPKSRPGRDEDVPPPASDITLRCPRCKNELSMPTVAFLGGDAPRCRRCRVALKEKANPRAVRKANHSGGRTGHWADTTVSDAVPGGWSASMLAVVRNIPLALAVCVILGGIAALVINVFKSTESSPDRTRPGYMSREEWDYMTTEFRNAGMTEAEAAEAARTGGEFLRVQEQQRERRPRQ